MKKTLFVIVSGLALSSASVWAAPGAIAHKHPTGTRAVAAAAVHPAAVQAGAAAIAANPAAQAKMDAAMAANPSAAATMNAVQTAAGMTPPAATTP